MYIKKRRPKMEYANMMVIDDYLLVAESIKELLKENLKPSLIKHFDSAAKAQKELQLHRYQHVFIGIKMHGRIRERFIKELRLRFPKLIIIALCSEGTINAVSSLFATGINGIVSTNEGVEELQLAMDKTMDGGYI